MHGLTFDRLWLAFINQLGTLQSCVEERSGSTNKLWNSTGVCLFELARAHLQEIEDIAGIHRRSSKRWRRTAKLQQCGSKAASVNTRVEICACTYKKKPVDSHAHTNIHEHIPRNSCCLKLISTTCCAARPPAVAPLAPLRCCGLEMSPPHPTTPTQPAQVLPPPRQHRLGPHLRP